MADGGEGTLEVLGGTVRESTVRGPLGAPVWAEWRVLDDGTAVVEMARASGLLLAGGAEGNDPIAATTHGTGELIGAALESGARKVIVAVGGSATTDGGLGAITALGGRRLRGVDVVVACDVTTTFVAAADVFAPQKGATPAQVDLGVRVHRNRPLDDLGPMATVILLTALQRAGVRGPTSVELRPPDGPPVTVTFGERPPVRPD